MTENTKNILETSAIVCLFSLLTIGGIYSINKADKAAREEKERKEREFEEFKAFRDSEIETEGYDDAIKIATLQNKNLSKEDRAYTYNKALKYLKDVKTSMSYDSFYDYRERLTNYINNLDGDKDEVESYVLYLKNRDQAKAEKAKEDAIRRSEREKFEAEEKAFKLKLQSEEKKADAVVESIKAIAGANKQSDVNVTINNDAKEESNE